MGRRATTLATQQSQTIDQRIAATEGSTVIRLEDGSVLDVEQLGDDIVFEALAFASETLGEAADFAGDQLAEGRVITQQALEFAERSSASEIQNTVQQLIKVGAVVAVATIAAAAAPKILKG